MTRSVVYRSVIHLLTIINLMSNFYIVDLENFATASRRYTGDIHKSTVVGLFMTPETMGADSVTSWLSAHCLSHIASD